MGDYTNGQLIVYKCPPEEVRAFLRHIEEWGLLDDWLGEQVAGDEIKLGHTYCSNDVRVGMVYESELSTAAPNSAWMQWCDPKYEFNGDIEIYTPKLGRFYASSDADGNVIVHQDQILALIAIEGATVESIRDGVRQLFGTAWLEAVGEIAPGGAERIIQAAHPAEEDS